MLIRGIELGMPVIEPFKAKLLLYNILVLEPLAEVVLLPHAYCRQLP